MLKTVKQDEINNNQTNIYYNKSINKVILGSNLEKKWQLLNFSKVTKDEELEILSILNSPNTQKVGNNILFLVKNDIYFILKYTSSNQQKYRFYKVSKEEIITETEKRKNILYQTIVPEIKKIINEYNSKKINQIINPKLLVYGSVANKLATKNSDIDVFLVYENDQYLFNYKDEIYISSILEDKTDTNIKISLQSKATNNSQQFCDNLGKKTPVIIFDLSSSNELIV